MTNEQEDTGQVYDGYESDYGPIGGNLEHNSCASLLGLSVLVIVLVVMLVA